MAVLWRADARSPEGVETLRPYVHDADIVGPPEHDHGQETLSVPFAQELPERLGGPPISPIMQRWFGTEWSVPYLFGTLVLRNVQKCSMQEEFGLDSAALLGLVSDRSGEVTIWDDSGRTVVAQIDPLEVLVTVTDRVLFTKRRRTLRVIGATITQARMP